MIQIINIFLGRRDAKESYENRQVVFPSGNFIKTYFASYSNDPITKDENDENDENPASNLRRAKQALIEERYEEIIPACTDEIEAPDGTLKSKILARLLRGTIYLLLGSLEAASVDFDYIINDTDTETSIKVNALIKRASLNVQNEQQLKGFQDFTAAEKLDPSNPDTYHQRGQVFILLDKLDEALADFNTALELDPEMCSAVVQKCYAEYRHAISNQNQVQIYKAIQSTHRAIEKFPNNIECYNILAQILCEQQQFDKADELFEKANQLQPTHATLYVHRGLLHLQWTGDVTKSVNYINKAIEVDDKCELAYETLGTIQVQRGMLENAIDSFDKALKLCRSEMEMMHIFSLRNAAIAQLNVAKKLGLDLSNLATMNAGAGTGDESA